MASPLRAFSASGGNQIRGNRPAARGAVIVGGDPGNRSTTGGELEKEGSEKSWAATRTAGQG
jgi:hypothetical protein